ncbi:MAG: hypothetical protein WBJ87_03730 [Candidatus Hydrothermia bacterium]
MVKLILLLSMTMSTDPWWAKDKVKHFATAFVLTESFKQASVNTTHSFCIVASLSFSKEVYDKKVKKSIFSYKDLLYDAAGIILGIFL